jgi:hypothetical protein
MSPKAPTAPTGAPERAFVRVGLPKLAALSAKMKDDSEAEPPSSRRRRS